MYVSIFLNVSIYSYLDRKLDECIFSGLKNYLAGFKHSPLGKFTNRLLLPKHDRFNSKYKEKA